MSYDLRSANTPRLVGFPMQAVCALAGQPGIGALVRNQLLRESGFDTFRAAQVQDAPAGVPLLPPPPSDAPDHELCWDRLTAASTRPPQQFAFETVNDFRAAYADARLDPVVVAKRLLEAWEQSEHHEPAMRIFIAQHADDLLEQAEASAVRLREKRALSILDGVPVVVKDEVDAKGYVTTLGSSCTGHPAASNDCEAVARLRAAGALIVGKANMHELGLGVTGINPHHGAARNPYDPTRITGGSSSGCAAAVAAGLAPLALGADGGGSIRMPSALCGVVGLKPTFGRVSLRGNTASCWTVAHLGPIAASAADAAIGYAWMAGPDPGDPASLRQPPVHLEGFGKHDLSTLRLGVFSAWAEDADAPVVDACKRALDELAHRGAKVCEVDIADLELVRLAHLVLLASEIVVSQRSFRERGPVRYSPEMRLNFALVSGLSSADFVHAQRVRSNACAQFARIFEQVDAIVTPTTGCTARPIRNDALRSGESDLRQLSSIMRFAPLANLTGLPAITFPVGYDAEGMPIGMQLMGRAWEEHRLLQVAAVAESFVERREPKWHTRLLS